MSKPRRSLIRSSLERLRQLWLRRETGRREMRRQLGQTFEALEPRLNMTISAPLPPIFPAPNSHIHPTLTILLDGQQLVIPAGIGLNGGAANPHTHDYTGTLHIGEGSTAGTSGQARNVNLDDFFDVWASSTLTQAATRNANALLDTVGLGSWKQSWTGSPTFALWTIFVVLVWQFAGQAMILYLAGLEGIPKELDEAAAIDGAGPLRKFTAITLPLLAPAFTISLTLTLIMGLRVFDQVIALTNGGPVSASETLATQVYKQAFVNGRFGYSGKTAPIKSPIVHTRSVIPSTTAEVVRRA